MKYIKLILFTLILNFIIYNSTNNVYAQTNTQYNCTNVSSEIVTSEGIASQCVQSTAGTGQVYYTCTGLNRDVCNSAPPPPSSCYCEYISDSGSNNSNSTNSSCYCTQNPENNLYYCYYVPPDVMNANSGFNTFCVYYPSGGYYDCSQISEPICPMQ
jgi:hypothetical protein